MNYLTTDLREYLENEGGKLTPQEQRALTKHPDAIKKLAAQLLKEKEQGQYPDVTERVPSFDCC